MKKLLFIICFVYGCKCFSQSLSLDQHLEKLNYNVTDCLSSFLSYPENHGNTLKVYEGLKMLIECCNQYLAQKGTLISRAPNNQAVLDISHFMDEVEFQKTLLEGFDKIIGSIAGYSRVGIDTPIFEECMLPLFKSLGWQIRLLSQKSQHIELYELSKRSFKMLMGKNTLPLPNSYSKSYNDVEATFFTYWQKYREEAPFLNIIMRGGKYRLLQYYDDSNPTYHTVTKVTSIKK